MSVFNSAPFAQGAEVNRTGWARLEPTQVCHRVPVVSGNTPHCCHNKGSSEQKTGLAPSWLRGHPVRWQRMGWVGWVGCAGWVGGSSHPAHSGARGLCWDKRCLCTPSPSLCSRQQGHSFITDRS